MKKVIQSLQNLIQNVKDIIRITQFLLAKNRANLFVLARDCLVNYFRYKIIGNSIRIDASDICQLRCPLCWHGQEKQILKQSYLKFDDFKKFCDNYPTFRNIEISDNGEMFLNPDLSRIVEYAYLKKIKLTARNGVNLNTVTEEMLECLVKYKFNAIAVSIDGATNQTYQIYRKGGNLDVVIGNIKKINHFKYKHHSKFPELIWQFIVFGHNEKELPTAREMARKLNMSFCPKLNSFDQSFSPIIDKEFIKKNIKYASREEYETINRCLYISPCYQLWFSPQISPTGELLGCCSNSSEANNFTFGNVFKLGLKNCLRSEKFIYAKKMLLWKKFPKQDNLCFSCQIYKKLQFYKMDFAISSLRMIRRSI